MKRVNHEKGGYYPLRKSEKETSPREARPEHIGSSMSNKRWVVYHLMQLHHGHIHKGPTPLCFPILEVVQIIHLILVKAKYSGLSKTPKQQ